MSEDLKQFGLRILPIDERDIKMGSVFKQPKPKDLPPEYELPPQPIMDQNGFDFCSTFAGVVASQDQEGVRLDPFFQFAMTKKEEGNLSWGADFRSLGKSFTKTGSIKLEDAPYGYDKPRDFLADWKNYSQELIDKAAEHKKKSYIFVKGAYDFMDDIMTALWLGKNKKQSVIMGATWQIEWTHAPGGIIDKMGTDLTGHAFTVRGWKVINGITYLKIQNSWGETGDKGYYYLTREMVNRFEPYGALFFEDLTPEELRYYIDNGILINESWLINFYKQIINIYKAMIELVIKRKEEEKPTPEPAPKPVPEPTPEPKKSNIIIWAEAIKVEEGWFQGSRSQRNHNPGNLKYTNLTASLGAHLKDKDNFAIFRTDEAGMNALCSFLTMACENRLKPYKDKTLYEFTEIYANPPVNSKYAKNVAKKLGVLITTPIKELL